MKINLQIADYRIRLTEAQDYPAFSWPMHPFDSFLDCFDLHPDIEITITVVEQLPNFSQGPLRFDACQGLWRLHETDAGLLLVSLDTKTHRPCAQALITKNFSQMNVWTLGEETVSGKGWVPMKILNPLVEVCLLSRLARDGGLLIHSAGILSSTGGYIFTGQSGAGKSTLSGFFNTYGSSVLSDERMIIRRSDDMFLIHGTPWVGSGAFAKNESGPLTELFCISHGAQHQIERLPPGELLALILPQCFLPHWDRSVIESTMSFLSDLIARVPCQRLTFAKQPDVVDYIQNQQTRTTLMAS